jgi:hypothetical protein
VSAAGNTCRAEKHRARAERATLTMHKSDVQFLVGTSEKHPPGDSKRACRSDVAQGANVPCDGCAEAPARLGTRGHKSVRSPGMQGHSGATCLQHRPGSTSESCRHPPRWVCGVGQGSPQYGPMLFGIEPLQRQRMFKWAQYSALQPARAEMPSTILGSAFCQHSDRLMQVPINHYR